MLNRHQNTGFRYSIDVKLCCQCNYHNRQAALRIALLGSFYVIVKTSQTFVDPLIIMLQGDPQLHGLHDQVLRQPRLQERGGELQLHVHQAGQLRHAVFFSVTRSNTNI